MSEIPRGVFLIVTGLSFFHNWKSLWRNLGVFLYHPHSRYTLFLV